MIGREESTEVGILVARACAFLFCSALFMAIAWWIRYRNLKRRGQWQWRRSGVGLGTQIASSVLGSSNTAGIGCRSSRLATV